MWERFTKDARAVVANAVDEAHRAGAVAVEPEHMMLALFGTGDTLARRVLTALGATPHRASVEQALSEARRRAGLSRADTDALAELGIDVSAIVSRVEEAHGVGALTADTAHGVSRRRVRQARRKAEAVGIRVGAPQGRPDAKGERRPSSRPPFTRGTRATLAKSLRIATARRERHIGDEHILLALLVQPGIAAEVLSDHGVTYTSVERTLPDVSERKQQAG